MAPLSAAAKSKNKTRDARRSRSRNTTPSSVLSAGAGTGVAATGPTLTPFLELEISRLFVTAHPQYGDIVDRLESKLPVIDPKQLQDLVDKLKELSESAERRVESCELAIRKLHEQYKDVEADQKERDKQAELARRTKARKEAQATEASKKTGKAKKRKDRVEAFDGVEVKHEEEAKPRYHRALDTPGPVDSPSPSKKAKLSPGTSSLSEVADSPPEHAPSPAAQTSPTRTDASMDEQEDNHVIHRPPPMPQQGFFPDPLAPDPVIYHIREVTPGMTDEDRKEIYSVTGFPTKDLSDQIAGTPPDKDFSNAKPTNQVAANTFLTYVEPYVRPLVEEDMAFLRERGDRTTPFLSVTRGKRHYSEIWAEEDGTTVSENRSDKRSANQAQGRLEDISDENTGTDTVSTGPLASRLLSLLRFEHRSPPVENGNGSNNDFTSLINGDVNDSMDLDGLTNGHDPFDKPLPPSTSVADLTGSKSQLAEALSYQQSDERIKLELRHLNLLGQDENPDFDAHHDDDISERLRLLQNELRRVTVVNGARKARLLDIAKERLAYQEYNTIHEDLDSQVQQAYLKRTRTLGKTKKGGAGAGKPKGGAQGLGGGVLGVTRPAREIGENARILMDRRTRWEDCIGPVFKDMKHGVPAKDTSLWDPRIMEEYEKAEIEAFEEEEGE